MGNMINAWISPQGEEDLRDGESQVVIAFEKSDRRILNIMIDEDRVLATNPNPTWVEIDGKYFNNKKGSYYNDAFGYIGENT